MLTRTLTALVAVLLLLLAGCSGDDADDAAGDPTAEVEDTEESEETGSCEYPDAEGAAREVDPPPAEPSVSGEVTVTFVTNLGEIETTLDAAGAPCTVNSLVSLAEQDFFDDTPCPRLAASPTFGILQCGDPSGTGGGGPGYSFADELSGDETYPAGTLAMANAGPDTNGSQFFFVMNDSELGPAYTVFGQVSEDGVTILQDVAAEGDDGSHPAGGGVPNQPVQIEDVVVG